MRTLIKSPQKASSRPKMYCDHSPMHAHPFGTMLQDYCFSHSATWCQHVLLLTNSHKIIATWCQRSWRWRRLWRWRFRFCWWWRWWCSSTMRELAIWTFSATSPCMEFARYLRHRCFSRCFQQIFFCHIMVISAFISVFALSILPWFAILLLLFLLLFSASVPDSAS